MLAAALLVRGVPAATVRDLDIYGGVVICDTFYRGITHWTTTGERLQWAAGVTAPGAGNPLLNGAGVDSPHIDLAAGSYFLYLSRPLWFLPPYLEVVLTWSDEHVTSATFRAAGVRRAAPWDRFSGDPGIKLGSTGISDQDRVSWTALRPGTGDDYVLLLETGNPEPAVFLLTATALLALALLRRLYGRVMMPKRQRIDG